MERYLVKNRMTAIAVFHNNFPHPRPISSTPIRSIDCACRSNTPRLTQGFGFPSTQSSVVVNTHRPAHYTNKTCWCKPTHRPSYPNPSSTGSVPVSEYISVASIHTSVVDDKDAHPAKERRSSRPLTRNNQATHANICLTSLSDIPSTPTTIVPLPL